MLRKLVGFSRLQTVVKPTGQPCLSAGGLFGASARLGLRPARPLTGGVRTVRMAFGIATINLKSPAAALAITSSIHRLNRTLNLFEGPSSWKKKTKKEEEFSAKCRRKRMERKWNFKPPDLPHFHSAADRLREFLPGTPFILRFSLFAPVTPGGEVNRRQRNEGWSFYPVHPVHPVQSPVRLLL